MQQKISKKFLIVLSVFVVAVLLIFWLIVSGIAESVIHTTAVKIRSWWYELQHPFVEPELLDDLKPGKYLLEREWGLDENDYVKVFDDHTVQFVSEYYETEDAKDKAIETEEKIFCGPYFSERNVYEMDEFLQFVHLAGISVGFSYADENTLEATRSREGNEDVINYDREEHLHSITAHYIYVGQ